MFPGEQQGDVHRDAGKNGFFDGGHAFGSAGDFHIEIGAIRLLVDFQGGGDGGLGIAGEQRRDFHGNPTVIAVCLVVDRTENVGRAAQVLQGDFNEQLLAREAGTRLLLDGGIVGGAAADGFIEYGRIRRESGDRQLIDIATQRAVVENVAGDVVQPKALAEIVECLGRFHVGT